MAKNAKKIVEELAAPVVEKLGYEYVDTEFEKAGKDWTLTVYIDKLGGVLLDDCEAVSRALDPLIDEADPIAGGYCLCVSSPGLDRPLKTKKDFERNMGSEVDVKLYKPFDGKKDFTGVLSACTDNTVTIESGDVEICFELPEVAKMNLHLDFFGEKTK